MIGLNQALRTLLRTWNSPRLNLTRRRWKRGARRAFGSAARLLLLSQTILKNGFCLWMLMLPFLVRAQLLYETNQGKLTITGYRGSDEAVIIPNTIKDLPVTRIKDSAFSGQGSLTSITIPNTITSIGDYAFQRCASLTNVTMGAGVTRLGIGAFSSCSGLTTIIIPNSVTQIGEDAFRNCTSLTNITIGSGVIRMGSRFSGCASLATITVDAQNPVYASVDGVWLTKTRKELIQCPEGRAGSYTVPDSVTRIQATGFTDCSRLTNITVSDAVTNIAWNAFSGCTGLISATIGKGISALGDNAFRNCAGLTGIAMSSRVTSIGNNAFADCTSLTHIPIPDSVTNIGAGAFSWCSSLTNITTPNTITSIGKDAFGNCTRLTNITIGRSVTNIGSRFSGCQHLSTITVDAVNEVYSSIDGVLFSKDQATLIRCSEGQAGSYTVPASVAIIADNAFSDCSLLTNITLANNVVTIGNRAFCYCSRLTRLRIPDSVTRVGEDVFRGCTSLVDLGIGSGLSSMGSRFSGCEKLVTITVDALNGVYSSVDDVLYDKSQTTLIQCPEGKAGICKIPNNVASIGASAFADCTRLTNIIMPDSITNIGVRAFCYCQSLTSISLPNNVTQIGGDAFRSCTRLTSLTIGSRVTSLGNRFSGCPGLKTITVDAHNSVYSSVDGVLLNKTQTLLIRCPEGKAGSCSIPDGITSIADDAFADCTSLKNITLPNTVTNIGGRAFSWCISLNTLTIPTNVANVGDRAFESCTGLTGVYFKGNAPTIGSAIFNNDDTITVYYLPGTKGWEPTFGGRPTSPWVAAAPTHARLPGTSGSIATGPAHAVPRRVWGTRKDNPAGFT